MLLSLGRERLGSRTRQALSGRAGSVAKVPDPSTPAGWILSEAEYTEAVRAVGAPAPRLLGIEEIAGRVASVWERVEGTSMWQHVVDRPDRSAAGTTERETGRVRLRKYVEIEDVHATVPVKRETARIEREPITDANVDQAMEGPEISEEEHEVVLHEEEAVAENRVVPKERVRLETDTETDEEQVSGTVRKERVEVDESGRDR